MWSGDIGDADLDALRVALIQYALRATGDCDVAEEIASEVIARLWYEQALIEPTHLLFLGIVMCRHLVIDRRRKLSRERALGHFGFIWSAGSEDAQLRLEREELLVELSVALSALTERQRLICDRYIAGDETAKEVASELECSVNTVYATAHQAALKLRGRLDH